MVTRTLFIQYDNHTGSGFVFDWEGRQYIITARHVVEGIDEQGSIQLNLNGEWHEIIVRLVGFSRNGADIAVLSADLRLSMSQCPEGNAGNIYYGHPVYFLGFPFGMSMAPTEVVTGSFPVPFIKQAIVSAMGFVIDNTSVICLDGFNNLGFSGGPVAYHANPLKPMSAQNPTKILGVVSGYRVEPEPIYIRSNEILEVTQLVYQANTGIVIVHPINDAIDIIKEYPIGLLIK